MTLRCAPAWALLAGLALCPQGEARAHPTFGVSTINRYARLVLRSKSRLRLSYTVMVGDLPALGWRAQADGNRDGRLDPGEQQALLLRVQKQVEVGVRLSQQGEPAGLAWHAEPLSLPDPQVAARAFAVELEAETSGQPARLEGPLSWQYRDQVELSPAGEIELRIEEGPAVSLQRTQGPSRISAEAPASAVPRLFQRDEAQAESGPLVVELQVSESTAQPEARPQRRWPAPALLGCLLPLAAALAWLARRRRA